MIAVIDNYDSFTYNLVQFLGCLGQDLKVFRNDKVTISELEALAPDHLVISPGPGWPEDAGITIPAIRHFAPKIPILGICLGHQAIARAFDGKVELAPYLMHGKSSPIFHTEHPLFNDVANPFQAGRYHSLVVSQESLPADLRIAAQTEDQMVMAIHHAVYPTFGVQFHPESILTQQGMQLLKNFLQYQGGQS